MKKLAAAVMLLLAATSTTGCAWFQAKETAVKDVLIDCAKQDLGASVAEAGESILLTVIDVIVQGGTDWEKDLSLLEGKYGADALACAEKVAEEIFRPVPTPVPAANAGPVAVVHARAAKAIAGKKFVK